MSPYRLLLAVTVVGFPLLESFLTGPLATSTRLEPRSSLQRRHAKGHRSVQPTCQRSATTTRRIRDGHFYRRRRRFSVPTASAAASESSTEDPPQQQQQQARPSRRNRPRMQPIPAVEDLLDDEAGVSGHAEVGIGDAGNGWVGVSGTTSSSLPEPKFEDRQRFGNIMEDVLGTEKEEELPALLTKHIDFLLSVDVTRMTNDLISQEPTMSRVQTLHNAYDFIVTFLEGLVESTLEVQKENRQLLREIIEVAKVGPAEFERAMKKQQDRFTFEFVKYLDAEVERMEKGSREKKVNKDKDQLDSGDEVLNVIKIVRVRVCAQVDLMMGEDVAILTRMLSYDDRFMMRAALRAVLGSKSPEAIDLFGRLVASTLKDVNQMGADVDPLLRRKLGDMADDVAVVARDIRDRQEEKKAEEAEA